MTRGPEDHPDSTNECRELPKASELEEDIHGSYQLHRRNLHLQPLRL